MSQVTQKKTRVYIGEYGPIVVGEQGQPTYGDVLRFIRKFHGYELEYVAAVYGKVAEGSPVTGRHILRMEQTDGFFPKDPKRRWVLATLLNVPPVIMAFLGLEAPNEKPGKALIPSPSAPVDIEEYYARLLSYRMDGEYSGVDAIDDIKDRVDRLHDTVLYIRSSQKQQMIRLLCGYQLLLADAAQEQGCFKVAKRYLTNAVLLAEEKQCFDLQTITLFQREAFFSDNGNWGAALHDFEAARQLKYTPVPHVQGRVLGVASRSKVRLAQDNHDLFTALRYLDDAEKLIKPGANDDILFSIVFDQERFFLDKAAALMASPIKRLRSPDKAQEYLTLATKARRVSSVSTQLARQANNDLIQAKIYNDQGYYPVAAVTAEQVLLTLKKLQSSIHMNEVVDLFKDIKAHYPHGIEIASLELELMKVQQPYLFN